MVNFDTYVVPFTPATPPPKPDSGSKNPAQNGLNSNDPSQQDGIWKDSVHSKDDHTTSIDNIGDEKMPSNLNSLGADTGGFAEGGNAPRFEPGR